MHAYGVAGEDLDPQHTRLRVSSTFVHRISRQRIGKDFQLTCISHHPTVEAHDKKAVIRVSCLVIREKP